MKKQTTTTIITTFCFGAFFVVPLFLVVMPSASGTWTSTGNLNTERYEHTATLLADGKLLVAGGSDSSGNASASSELYDASSGTWTVTGSLNTERTEHTATLSANGMVLVAAGT